MSSHTEDLLGESERGKSEYRRLMEETLDAIVQGYPDGKAYGGKTPDDLKKAIKGDILPEEGIGYDAVLEKMKRVIIPNFVRTSSPSYMAHLHSPALLESLAAEAVITSSNQSMDSWDQSPIATEVEIAVIRELCVLYGYPHGDGTFTSGGSQSNLQALFLARDWYCNEILHHDVKKLGLPSCATKLRLYTSEISHFSMEKSAHLLGLGYQAVVKVPVDSRCRMDADALRLLVAKDRREGNIPFCVVATIGTTDYGSIDPVGEISMVAKEEGMWLHGDAAYGSAAILSSFRERLGDLSLCDSLTIDFHKMFLLPISCSTVLVKEGKDLEPCMLHADYLNREEDEEEGYENLVGKSLQTTRRFDALKVWVSFQTRGRDGMRKIIDTCIRNAAYVYERLQADDAWECVTEPELSSVVFRLKGSDEMNKRMRRDLLLHGTVIGQTVHQGKTYVKFTLLNPSITHQHLDALVSLIRKTGEGYREKASR